MPETLKQCPICSRDNYLQIKRWTYLYRVLCLMCGTQGPARQTEAEAATAWNARASEWRDISTAPKDGSPVLTWEPNSERVVENHWKDWGDELSHWAFGEPTHWQPLPEPPEAPHA
jgi:hypothetical protein